MSLTEREKEYSPSSCIEDIETYISAYVTKSEEARRKMGEGKQLAYRPKPSQLFDFFSPVNNE